MVVGWELCEAGEVVGAEVEVSRWLGGVGWRRKGIGIST